MPLLPQRNSMANLTSQVNKQWGQDPINLDYTGMGDFWDPVTLTDIMSYLWSKNPKHPLVKIKPPLSFRSTLTIAVSWKNEFETYSNLRNFLYKEIFQKIDNETITRWTR